MFPPIVPREIGPVETWSYRWYKLGSQRKFLRRLVMLKPDLPFGEYQDKMDRLQQVIVAHTGKQLYDLRDEKITWW